MFGDPDVYIIDDYEYNGEIKQMKKPFFHDNLTIKFTTIQGLFFFAFNAASRSMYRGIVPAIWVGGHHK